MSNYPWKKHPCFWQTFFLTMEKNNAKLLPGPKTAGFFFRRKHGKVGGFLRKIVMMRGRHRIQPKTHPDALWKFTKSVGPKNSTMKFSRDMNFSGAFYIKKCHMISSWVDVCLSPPKAAFVFLPVSFNEKKTRRLDFKIKRKSWVPLGEYPRYIPTYTTYIWIL